MADPARDDFTLWLVDWSNGRPEALERLVALVRTWLYRELEG